MSESNDTVVSKNKDTFIKGALILTAAGIVVKLIGAVNRILLSRLLGGEGIGLYQMAYPIYLLATAISSAGIPVAISVIVAEKIALQDSRGAKRVFLLSLGFLTVTGVIFTVLLYLSAGWLTTYHIVRDPRAYWAIVALAPAIFFVTILSSYRGYFQGLQKMTPTAVSQIFEQLVRVVTMIFLAYLLIPKGLEFAAAGASFGAGPGALAGLLVLIYFYWKQRAESRRQMEMQPAVRQEPGTSIIKRIVTLALPVSLANIMLPVVSNLDLTIVPRRLEVAGYTVGQATELFGYLTGMATALIGLPTILTASLAISLVPAVSAAYTLRDHQRIYQRTATAMKIANFITLPSFAGMCLLAVPISQMLYGTPNAGNSIAVLSLGIVLLGIQQVTTGVLQGLGRTKIALINTVVSAAVKVVLSWFLTAMPSMGIEGAAWATNADFGVAALLNMYFVYRYVGFTLHVKDSIRAVAATLLMSGAVLLVYHGVMIKTFHNTPATLLAIGVGGLVYALALLVLGGVQSGDIEKLPRLGGKLAAVLRRTRLLRK